MPGSPSGRTWLLLALLTLSTGVMAACAARPDVWEGFAAAAIGSGVLTVLIWRRGDVSMPLVIGFALFFRLGVFWLPPVLSDDVYRYVWDGVVQAEGHNPFLYTPDDPAMIELRDEPIYDDLNSVSYHSVYPPISQYVFRAGALFYGAGWQTSYFVIKGLLALMEFAAVLVLARMLGASMLLLYAWNPAVVMAGAGQAHGEAALVLFLSLTLAALRSRRGVWASVWLALAGWVKLYPFVLFPFVWRRYGWKSVFAGAGTAVLAAAPFAHPDVISNVRESLELYVRLFEFNAGPYYSVKKLFSIATGQDWSKQIGPAFRALFLMLLPVVYVLDWKRSWSARRAFVITVGAFFLLSTTIHPWYLLGILVLVAPAARPSWHWYFLSVASLGTYLLYVDGPYWTWVVIGWTGWACLAGYRYRRLLLDPILRARAAEKAELLAVPLGTGWSLLDVGAAEGYVGKALAEHTEGHVELVDVVDRNRTDLPHFVYDGQRLPFESNTVDAAVLSYVLHHAEHPEILLKEAVRVSRRRVVVLESTYERDWERAPLYQLDRLANHLRSEGTAQDQGAHLRFRTHDEWLATFDRLGVGVIGEKRLGGFIHHRSLFVLDSASSA